LVAWWAIVASLSPAGQPAATPTAGSTRAAIGGGDRAPAPPDTIVVLSFDALRADHLSSYGYPRATSTELDRLFGQSRVFDRVITPKGKTGPALASLMTGLYPVRHGALKHGWNLWPSVSTAARLLDGYESAAFVANAVPREWVEEAGFDFTKVYRGAPATRVLRDAALWLEEQASKKIFLWIHLIEPHFPYEPPAEDLERFVSDPWFDVAARTDYNVAAAARKLDLPLANDADAMAVREAINLEVAKYDAYVRFATREAAEFLQDVIDRREKNLFVITADHGESMVEHDYYFWHGEYCTQPVIQVPLAIYFPGGGLTGHSSANVSLADIVPTLCSLAGCTETSGFDGQDLLGTAGLPTERVVFSSALDHPTYSKWAIIKGDIKLVIAPDRRFALLDGLAEMREWLVARWLGGGRPHNTYRLRALSYEIYDLANDPGEAVDLSGTKRELRATLTEELLSWLDDQYARAALAGVDLDQKTSAETLDELRSLGYIN
jgi:arylsulfatase